MNYIINKTILYSPESKQFSLLLHSDSYIVLSNQASRLIVEMIQNNKLTLTREHLLQRVWEDFGSVPSNNNLYMAVSELRKAFRSFGITDKLITTVPKVGFIFEAEIDVIPRNNTQTETVITESNEIQEQTPKIKHQRWPLYLASIMFLLVSFFSPIYLFQTGDITDELTINYPAKTFTIEYCDFLFIREGSGRSPASN